MAGPLKGHPSKQSSGKQLYIVLALGLVAGYFVGMALMETADVMFTTKVEHKLHAPNQEGHLAATKPAGDTIHSLLTSNGSPYQNFQGRIMYGTYRLVQQMPGGEKLTGFTRIMHRMKDDEVVDEIPTFRATPLHPECDTYCDFPVADRANAVTQWIQAVDQDPSLLKGQWVFLLECDYVWMKPVQAPDAGSDAPGMQFHFDYIDVNHPVVQQSLGKLVAGKVDLAAVPNSGPAPALLRYSDFTKVVPLWEKMTADVEADPVSVKSLGWVREMYAWDVAIALAGVNMLTQGAYESPLLVQPPHDDHFGNGSICHYTWGAIYKDKDGKEVFRWEKRDYTSPENALKVPHLPMPPQPFQAGAWRLQGGEPVTENIHTILAAMLGQMNKAIDTLPDLSGRKIQ